MKMLAVRKEVANYVSYYEVTYTSTFEEAKEKIIEAELNNTPHIILRILLYSHEFAVFHKCKYQERTKLRIIPRIECGMQPVQKLAR